MTFMQKIFFMAIRLITLLLFFGVFSSSVLAVAEISDLQALQGRWIRTDGPYTLEFSQVQSGTLQAAYFNPNPINVGRTETAEQSGSLQILVELQDINYSGSTYILEYDHPQEMLKGIYFLPVSKQKYNVIFVRQLVSP